MIEFVLTRGHYHTLREVRSSKLAPPIRLTHYDRLFRTRRFPGSTYIFSDLDRLSHWDLELAGHLYLELKNAGVRVLNNPARVKQRYALLRSLHDAGLNDFNVYRPDGLGDAIRFPVFVRKQHGHRPPLTDLLHTRREIDEAIAAAVATGIPAENLVVVEYAGEPVREGLFRKLAVFRIGDRIVPYLCGHDTHWLVKTGQTGIAGEALYRDELNLIETNPHAEYLRKIFDLAEIEYGRLDFGFRQGRIQTFEINTNPSLFPFAPHPSPLREQSMRLTWSKIMEALRELDRGDTAPVRFTRRDKLHQYRRWTWSNFWTHSRKPE